MASRAWRLNKMEEAIAPVSRQIIIWDDGTPSAVKREIAAHRADGRATDQDQFVIVRWMSEADTNPTDLEVDAP
jgi:hypothetical protein